MISTINCHDCGVAFQSKRRHRERCDTCERLKERRRAYKRNSRLRALNPVLRRKPCVICRAEFIPPKSMNQMTCSPTCCKERRRRMGRKSRLYLTLEQYDSMLSAQKGCCAVCGVASAALAVDHSHETGEIRALLCRNCNLALGFVKERATVAFALANYIIQRCGGVKAEVS